MVWKVKVGEVGGYKVFGPIETKFQTEKYWVTLAKYFKTFPQV